MGRHLSTNVVAAVVGMAALLLSAAPAAAFTVYLKDGSTIIAQSEYEIRDGKAYLTLVNGTETVLDVDEIDVDKTERANEGRSYSGAVILEDAKTAEIPPPPRQERQDATLSDLIRSGRAGTAAREPRESVASATPRADSAAPAPVAPGSGGTSRTPAGYVDLVTFPRQPAAHEGLAETLRSAFREGSLQQVKVYQGTRAGYPLVEITTTSESAVLRALAVGASALHRLAERFPGDLAGLELLMLTPDRRRGGQFQLAPEDAEALIQRRIDPATFFLENVQF